MAGRCWLYYHFAIRLSPFVRESSGFNNQFINHRWRPRPDGESILIRAFAGHQPSMAPPSNQPDAFNGNTAVGHQHIHAA